MDKRQTQGWGALSGPGPGNVSLKKRCRRRNNKRLADHLGGAVGTYALHPNLIAVGPLQ